jgi:hypothetical protein
LDICLIKDMGIVQARLALIDNGIDLVNIPHPDGLPDKVPHVHEAETLEMGVEMLVASAEDSETNSGVAIEDCSNEFEISEDGIGRSSIDVSSYLGKSLVVVCIVFIVDWIMFEATRSHESLLLEFGIRGRILISNSCREKQVKSVPS